MQSSAWFAILLRLIDTEGRTGCADAQDLRSPRHPVSTRNVTLGTRCFHPAGAITALLAAWFAAAGAAAAQQAGAVDCPEGRIASVRVVNQSVFDLSDPDLNGRFGWAYRLANRLHVPTRDEVIRRELLFREGSCYRPELLRESEVVLRATGFLAEVAITAGRRPDGHYEVTVRTRDDWSTRVDLRMGSGGASDAGIFVREDNLLGTGHQLSAFSLRAHGMRTYGASYVNPHLFGTRVDAGVALARTPVGHYAAEALTYPFVGERGRWAVRQQGEHHDRYFGYVAYGEDGLTEVFLPERRRLVDAGAVYRFGGQARRTMVGAAVAGEWITYPREARFGEGGSPLPADLPLLDSLGARMDSVANVRVVFLAGQRNVVYVRRRALDAVAGVEDVPLGVEMEVGLGRTLAPLSTGDDISMDFGLFAAGEARGGVLGGVQLLVEGKRDYDAPEGRSELADLLGRADAWVYWRRGVDSRHTLVGAVRAAGGWNTTVPFQLTLGEAAGLRGYPYYVHPGGRRVVATLEGRSHLGWPFPRLFDLGTAVFVDVGRSWSGDLPFRYGADSPWRASVGAGLRGAFPAGSRRMYRMDVALPLGGGDVGGGPVLSIGIGQAVGFNALRGDPQLQRSSRRGISTSLFTFPNRPEDVTGNRVTPFRTY